MEWAKQAYSAEQLAGTLAATSICFDLSVFEIFAPLACGGTVILAENVLGLVGGTVAGAERVTLVNTVPSALAEVMRLNALPATVRTVNLAGEVLTGVLAQQVYQHTQVSQVYNLYGPTEDTTYSTYQAVKAGAGQPPTIGRPIANTRVYILTAQQRLVPIGVQGELYLSGAGLARGYLGEAEKTAERFVPDPYSEVVGERMYRTGDQGRYLASGEIEFLGRGDQQVKLRGYRIELGEIEEVLRGHGSVQEAVVGLREEGGSGGEQLVCYVVAAAGAAVSGAELQRYLEERLPGYMVPVGWQLLAELPLTPNGKLDRRALAGAEIKGGAREYVAPRSVTEQRVAEIWSQVLGVKRVGVEENFFELGGHSLLATQAVSRLRAEFGVEIALRWMFEAPTVARLAKKIESVPGMERALLIPPITRLPRPAELPTSFGQERLWFLHELDPQSSAYNMSAVARLRGALTHKRWNKALTRSFSGMNRCGHNSLL